MGQRERSQEALSCSVSITEIRTWAHIKSQMPNGLNHPGALIIELDPITFSPFSARIRLHFVCTWNGETVQQKGLTFLVLWCFLSSGHCGLITSFMNAGSLRQVFVAGSSFLPSTLCLLTLWQGVLPACQSQPDIHSHQVQPVDCGAPLTRPTQWACLPPYCLQWCSHIVFSDV